MSSCEKRSFTEPVTLNSISDPIQTVGRGMSMCACTATLYEATSCSHERMQSLVLGQVQEQALLPHARV
eukprot:6211428-Pleurochrysis_carterae.AAC.1